MPLICGVYFCEEIFKGENRALGKKSNPEKSSS